MARLRLARRLLQRHALRGRGHSSWLHPRRRHVGSADLAIEPAFVPADGFLTDEQRGRNLGILKPAANKVKNVPLSWREPILRLFGSRLKQIRQHLGDDESWRPDFSAENRRNCSAQQLGLKPRRQNAMTAKLQHTCHGFRAVVIEKNQNVNLVPRARYHRNIRICQRFNQRLFGDQEGRAKLLAQ